ncbi:phosphate regulon transcriptional regulatory protein PhoB [Limosilactobacillus frumenti DSM 13145]|uniref:Phosphate regulon transcriptional regulatory protein PhoB n=1 Tax=Limosilactobacillus frumenti DSM 13145 TaxID=1423746 RepID=A0A0R1P8W3_9LACO|nr:response regulator transcription factor [Limosilactobacillus frumenti]KRL28700.1 phosphate regulon transcriptional regulatory protein PhoB [Limosilactobacillus frumenti DSM 13145]MBA2914720.1 response regulator transcription factor [Limosilactobacillus frumenti]QFG72044.1 response regulator transcription factor [Limosilactobacillus frumenti]
MRILLAEDEHQLSHVVVTALTSQGYSVDPVYNGQEAVDHAKQNAYDLMILDIMMPVKTGLEALREIRATGDRTYVMMLTAMAEIDDKVTGLDAGADDYLTKPFSLKELLARVRSLDRRNGSLDRDVLTFADLTLDDNEQTLSAHNSISLTNKETRLLQYMILNADKQLTVADLLNHTWDDDDESADEEDVWFTISYLRQKIKSVNSKVVIDGEKGGPFTLKSH